jgi:hypothetical protein
MFQLSVIVAAKMELRSTIFILLVFSALCLSVMAQDDAGQEGSEGGQEATTETSGNESGGTVPPTQSSAAALSNVIVDIVHAFRGFLF